ncbi:hypothetical protein HDV04_003042 [Boothiomyces sp. JEL0838]|nr:hypothetical protein HDV04_003042 [Boothiomyces sp. JEL0838]
MILSPVYLLLLFISYYATPTQPPPYQRDPSDIPTVTTYFKYSLAAYCQSIYPSNNFNCTNCHDNQTQQTTVYGSNLDSATTGFGYVARNNATNTIIIAFRGTLEFQSFVEDLKFWQVDPSWKLASPRFIDSNPKGIQIHDGFQETYLEIRETILSAAFHLAMAHPQDAIIFTGHSMGGVLALFAAIDFNDRWGMQERFSIYTYGLPRSDAPGEDESPALSK